ncbi:50S ribosomal protein L37ae, partial [Candidatus Micrarchaeota archaeon]|nr:50S ribosomal protein L37ae [Candidatus Micrarchaeota archaeon]
MPRTKLGSASRFGARYGSPLKQVVADIEKTQKTKQPCPKCGRVSLRRRGYSRWECSKCNATMAGGAYAPRTELGSLIEKIVRKGAPVEELLEAAESTVASAAPKKPVRSLKKTKRKKRELSPQEQEAVAEEEIEEPTEP